MYKPGDACPICGAGQLTRKEITAEFDYKGEHLEVPNYIVWECAACSESLVDKGTLKEAGRKIRDFHRLVNGLLTASEIKRIRKFKLEMKQDELSRLLGGGEKSFARYENCEVIQNESMDNLLRILDVYPHALSVLQNKKTNLGSVTMPPVKFNYPTTSNLDYKLVSNYGK